MIPLNYVVFYHADLFALERWKKDEIEGRDTKRFQVLLCVRVCVSGSSADLNCTEPLYFLHNAIFAFCVQCEKAFFFYLFAENNNIQHDAETKNGANCSRATERDLGVQPWTFSSCSFELFLTGSTWICGELCVVPQ